MTVAGAPLTTQQRLDAIFARYRSTLEAQLQVVDDAVLALREDRLVPDVRAQAHRVAHKLAGSAGTFGYVQASDVARRMELALAPGPALDRDVVEQLCEWAVALRAALSADAASDGASPGASAGAPALAAPGAAAPVPAPAARPGPAPAEAALTPVAGVAARPDESQVAARTVVLLVEPEPQAAERLAVEAAGRGVDVELASTAAEARRLLETLTPVAAVVALPDEPQVAEESESLLARLTGRSVPVVALARSASFAVRAELARLGVSGLELRPATASGLLDAVDRALDRVRLGGATVLVAQDDPIVAAVARRALTAEGATVLTAGSPGDVWATLERSAPDLLVVDLDLAGVGGLDLCRMVRADPRWAHLPVLITTGSSDPATTAAVLGAGADDLVATPLDPQDLLARVATRLERLHGLRRPILSDPLTGAADRSRATQHLQRLIRLAARYHQPLAIGVLRVDGLERVDADHGPTAGDQVLRELGVHLLRAFRTEDVVARWDGGTLLVALYGSHACDAARRLDAVLEAFRRRPFTSATGEPFSASFSAGVAEHGVDHPDLPTLHRAADSARRAASLAGGGRVQGADVDPEGGASVVDVLLVTGDEDLAQPFLRALDARGLRTEWLRDADLAAERLTGAMPVLSPRVVVLDRDLPAVEGPGSLRDLADDGLAPGTRVVTLARRARPDDMPPPPLPGSAADQGADPVAERTDLPALVQRVLTLLGAAGR